MRSAASACSSKLVSLFENNSTNEISEDNVSDSYLSDVVLQFAHDVFNGVKNTSIPETLMNVLQRKAISSIKFKLFLHAVNKLKSEPELSDGQERVVKLCLSRIVNLLNKDYITIYHEILGDRIMSELKTQSKRHLSPQNHLEPSTRIILDKVMNLSDELEILSIINAEKLKYLKNKNRTSQTYQVLVILEYLINSFNIWEKTLSQSPSELTYYRAFIPILEQVLSDTDAIVKDGESKSISSVRHMQWNGELYDRKSSSHGGYEYGKKIDFILKDKWSNELNTSEFKKENVSKSVMFDQQIKNLCDNSAIMIESKRAIKKDNININGIDYIGDTSYLYQLDEFGDVLIATPISI